MYKQSFTFIVINKTLKSLQIFALIFFFMKNSVWNSSSGYLSQVCRSWNSNFEPNLFCLNLFLWNKLYGNCKYWNTFDSISTFSSIPLSSDKSLMLLVHLSTLSTCLLTCWHMDYPKIYMHILWLVLLGSLNWQPYFSLTLFNNFCNEKKNFWIKFSITTCFFLKVSI